MLFKLCVFQNVFKSVEPWTSLGALSLDSNAGTKRPAEDHGGHVKDRRLCRKFEDAREAGLVDDHIQQLLDGASKAPEGFRARRADVLNNFFHKEGNRWVIKPTESYFRGKPCQVKGEFKIDREDENMCGGVGVVAWAEHANEFITRCRLVFCCITRYSLWCGVVNSFACALMWVMLGCRL